jgi:hypothetical protein
MKPKKTEEYLRVMIHEYSDDELSALRHHWSGATALGEARTMVMALIDVVQGRKND